MTGAGKSVIVADLLAQTGHRFGLRLIVEECARRFMFGHLLGVLERPSFSS
jgi:DNA repair ATPase RecN